MMQHIFRFCLLLSLSLGFTGPSLADMPVDTTAVIQKELPGAKKLGEGTYRWFALKLYDATLWTNVTSRPLDYKKDSYWLELTYARSFEGAKIAEASKDEIEKQGISNTATRESWEKKLASAFPNVEKGSRLAGLHVPGSGVRFFKDGKEVAKIDDVELAHAFFAIWLDPKTSSPKFRSKLLGLSTD